MEFGLNSGQRALRDTVRDLTTERIADHHPTTDDLRTAFRVLGEAGLPGLMVDSRWGGAGADPVGAVVALEALGRGCRDNGLLFALNAHLWAAVTPIARFGTDEQRRRLLPGLCAGELIGGQAMTEPDSGSDAFALATTAVPTADGYVLNGTKTFTTNAPVADVLVVFATLDRRAGWAGLSAFLVERGQPGLVIGPRQATMGLTSAPLASIHLDDCRVAATQALGPIGAGLAVFNHAMDAERGYILAPALGAVERQIDGLRGLGAASDEVGDLHVRAATARLLLYRMAWLRAQGAKITAAAALGEAGGVRALGDLE